MSKLLVGNSLVEVKVFYKILPNGNIYVNKETVLPENENFECLTTKWAQTSWQAQSWLNKTSTTYNPETGIQEFNFISYQDNLLKSCLKEWDLKDEKDVNIPVTPDNINLLHSSIASELINRYMKLINPNKEDLKK